MAHDSDLTEVKEQVRRLDEALNADEAEVALKATEAAMRALWRIHFDLNLRKARRRPWLDTGSGPGYSPDDNPPTP